jgi:hypothetical protein
VGQAHTEAVGPVWALRALGAGVECERAEWALRADVAVADLPCASVATFRHAHVI